MSSGSYLFPFRFHEIIDDVLSFDEAMPNRYRSRNDQQKHHTSKLGSKSKGNYSISDTQRLLKKESDVNKRKVDVRVKFLSSLTCSQIVKG